MICYPGAQQLRQRGACWSTRIEKETYLTPTACLIPPSLHNSRATHTSGWQIVNLASLKLMFFSTPLILTCFDSPCCLPSTSPLSPSLSYSHLFSLYSLVSPAPFPFLPHVLEAGNIKWDMWATAIILASSRAASSGFMIRAMWLSAQGGTACRAAGALKTKNF